MAAGNPPGAPTPPAKEGSHAPAPQGGTSTAVPAPPGTSTDSTSTTGLTLSVLIRQETASDVDSVSVEIEAASSVGVVDAPLHLLYDPAQLRFLDASEGNYMSGDGAATVFLVNAQSRPGDVLIGIGRSDRSRGAGGSGTLCTLRFVVLATGTVRVAIGRAMAWAVDGSLLPVTTGAAEIKIP